MPYRLWAMGWKRFGTLSVLALLLLAACGPDQTEIVCDQATWNPPSPLECQAAIDTATAALPADHAQITRITFRYGNYCPPGWECPMTSSEYGVVFFEFAFPSPTLYVEVVATDQGVMVRTPPTPGSL